MITAPPSEAHSLSSQVRLWLQISAYTVGLTASTTITGAIFGVLGSVARKAFSSGNTGAWLWLLCINILAFAYGLHELGYLHLPMPQVTWQVPSRWVRLGRLPYALIFGLILGAEVFTLMPFATFYILILWEITLGPSGGALLGVVYGLARAAPTLVGITSSYYRAQLLPFTSCVTRARNKFHTTNGMALVVVAGLLLARLIME